MTLQDRVKDVNNADWSSPSRRSDFSHSMGNSTNDSKATSKATIRQHTIRTKALTKIALVDKNYTLENNLNDTQVKMAAMIAQNKLLQDQLLVLQRSSEPPLMLAEDIAQEV
jgi:hypothetical protein